MIDPQMPTSSQDAVAELSLAPGTHVVDTVWVVRLRDNDWREVGRFIHTERFEVEVVDASEPLIQVVNQPSAEIVSSWFGISQVMLCRQSDGTVTATLGTNSYTRASVPLAFHLYARVPDGNGAYEYVLLGNYLEYTGHVRTSNQQRNSQGSVDKLVDMKSVDVVARSSFELAESVPAIDRVWVGEVLFKDVLVRWFGKNP